MDIRLEIKGDGETGDTVCRNSAVKFPRKGSFIHSPTTSYFGTTMHWVHCVDLLFLVQSICSPCPLYLPQVEPFYFFSPVSHCIINVSSKID